MSMRKTFIALTAALALPLGACANMQDNPKQTGGTLAGAGLGALAGSQIGSGTGQLAAVAIGALTGAWAGSEIGKSLDKADKMYAQRTTQNALEYNRTGQTSSWRNPDSGHSGTVTPVETYEPSGNDRTCREYETTIYVDGKRETGRGTACRQLDGSWELVNN